MSSYGHRVHAVASARRERLAARAAEVNAGFEHLGEHIAKRHRAELARLRLMVSEERSLASLTIGGVLDNLLHLRDLMGIKDSTIATKDSTIEALKERSSNGEVIRFR